MSLAKFRKVSKNNWSNLDSKKTPSNKNQSNPTSIPQEKKDK